MNIHNKGYTFVFMGVTSCGKSSVGISVSKILDCKFIDGDDLHTRNNILKMESGVPLTDDDREPWLNRINDVAFSVEKKNEVAIVVSSALKRKYRDTIRNSNNKVRFIFLSGSFDLILSRMAQRVNHFMPVELIKSQFDILEPPMEDETDITMVSIEGTMDDVIRRCINAITQILKGSHE